MAESASSSSAAAPWRDVTSITLIVLSARWRRRAFGGDRDRRHPRSRATPRRAPS